MMKYSELRKELFKQNGGDSIDQGQKSPSWLLHSKTTWKGRTGVFLHPKEWGVQEFAALEIFHLPSEKIKLSLVVKGTKDDKFCEHANSVIIELDESVNGRKILCPNGSRLVKNKDKTTALVVHNFGKFEDDKYANAAKEILEFLKCKDNPWITKINDWVTVLSFTSPGDFFENYEKNMQKLEKRAAASAAKNLEKLKIFANKNPNMGSWFPPNFGS